MFEVRNLSSCWNLKSDKPVFSNLNFILPQNELTALCGINGCGKSTLLSAMAGIVPPNLKLEGQVLVDGKNFLEQKARENARQVSFLIQNENNVWDITVEKLIEGGRFVHQKWYENNSDYDNQIIDSAISALHLEALRNRPISTLSGGEVQRARIARSIVQETPYILLDEPLAGLDLNFQKDLLLLLKDLCKKGKTIFLSIHDINFASIYADNMILLKQDRTGFFSGKPDEMMREEILTQVFGISYQIYTHPVTGSRQIF